MLETMLGRTLLLSPTPGAPRLFPTTTRCLDSFSRTTSTDLTPNVTPHMPLPPLDTSSRTRKVPCITLKDTKPLEATIMTSGIRTSSYRSTPLEVKR
ncbi:unnamed protein product [Leptidea sinapis]|uniref:Uncharacterized protein n=1 Tax=Leptidea sinapis TaxID=189913 RepID=A0A5E4PVT3_9NEOP|nr:unnamed protein product [Leptidea sinapis]